MADRFSGRAKTILFFARARPDLVALLEFYTEDIQALRALGFNVRIETVSWRAALASESACYAWWWHSAAPVVLAWRLRGRPVVVTGALGEPREPSLRTRAKGLLAQLSARLASANIAISDSQLRIAPLNKRARRIYLSVDTEYYVPATKAATPLGVIVAQVNPLSIQRKGIDVAIAATAHIRRELPEYRLAVVGPVTQAGARTLAELRRTVDFTGVDIHGEVARDGKRELLSSAWVCLQPSTFEGFGVSVVEAMSCGTVPVCSDRGSLPEIVGGGGVIARSRDPAVFAHAVTSLLRDESYRRALQKAARERAVAEFSRERHVAALQSLFSDLSIC
jgi:glycosyltransferase involved in cell wall biosynthesis